MKGFLKERGWESFVRSKSSVSSFRPIRRQLGGFDWQASWRTLLSPHQTCTQWVHCGELKPRVQPPAPGPAHSCLCIPSPEAWVRGLQWRFPIVPHAAPETLYGLPWLRHVSPCWLGIFLLLLSPSPYPQSSGLIKRQESFVWGSLAVRNFSCHLTPAWCCSVGKNGTLGCWHLCLLPSLLQWMNEVLIVTFRFWLVVLTDHLSRSW